MLLVPTDIKKSSIPGAGLGCFAKEFIPKGTKIWEYTPQLDREYSESEYNKISGMDKNFLETYIYRNRGTYYLCVDNGRFINHSETPNTWESTTENATFAERDIFPGEEILSDYTKFGVTEEDLKFNTIL